MLRQKQTGIRLPMLLMAFLPLFSLLISLSPLFNSQASASSHNHRVFLERYQLAFGVGQTDYTAKIEFISALVTSSNPGSVDILVTAKLSDNLGEGLNSPNLVPLNNEGTLNITMRDWNNDGVYDLQINDSTLYKK